MTDGAEKDIESDLIRIAADITEKLSQNCSTGPVNFPRPSVSLKPV